MKAIEDFVIALNKDRVRVSYRVGVEYKDIEFIEVKKGKEIPEEFIKNIIEHSIQLVDVQYKNRVPILPKELQPEPKLISKKMEIKKRKYTQDSLTKIKNEQGFSALKEIGKEFGVTDRSSNRLIIEILREQEEKQRAGL